VSFGEVAMPVTEHSGVILAGSWPSQSVMAWSGYAMGFSQAANRLFEQLQIQYDIKDILAPMSGAFIDAARALAQGREIALMNRIEGYRYLSGRAHWAANELHSTKSDLVEIVTKAEEDIGSARDVADDAKVAASGNPVAIAAIESNLQAAVARIVATAKADATQRDSDGASTVADYTSQIATMTSRYANHMMPQSSAVPTDGIRVSGLPPVPASPAPRTDSGGSSTNKSLNYDGKVSPPQHDKAKAAANSDSQSGKTPSDIQQASVRHDAPLSPEKAATDKPAAPSSPPATAPSAGGSSGGGGSGPASMVGQMVRPPMSSSPGSTSAGAGGGGASPVGGQAGSQLPGAGAGSGAGSGSGGGGRGLNVAGLGTGIADTSARLATGAVNATAGAFGAVGNVGGQVAQSVAAAAAQTVPTATTSVPPAGAGTPPMAMMPPAAAPSGPVTSMSSSSGAPAGGHSVSATGGGTPPPTTTVAGQSSSPIPGATATSSAASSMVAPVAVPVTSIRGIGADGATGDALFDQAADIGKMLVTAMIAQTRTAAHIPIDYAVSLIWERGGSTSAWLATSEGASYIPLGVRVPNDVGLAVTDPVIGRQLWDQAVAAGGADPLEMVVRHAEVRESSAPGARVLAVASSLPVGRVMDWAGVVGARPVSVDPRTVDPGAAVVDGSLLHRCAVAMPWEWRQANAFTERDRLKVASRHMRMASASGHLHGPSCEKVMRLFEERKPISPELWAGVQAERFEALTSYQLADQMRGHGGSEPARLLLTARAAEVVECLQRFDTAEGCADILYAARLAGAPLNPAAAVA